DAVIGTGPFILKSYDKGVRMVFERNPDYFMKPLPYLDGVVVDITPDAAARLSVLRAGKAELPHIWGWVSPEEARSVEGAKALGSGPQRIPVGHLLPNVLATIIVVATTGLSTVILAEESLSFLGLGVPPPYPTWGGMLSLSGLDHMYRAPWLAIWPAVALSLAVFGFNMLGDALRDLLDPRLKGR